MPALIEANATAQALRAAGLDAESLRRLADELETDQVKERKTMEREAERIRNQPAVPRENYSEQLDTNRIENAGPIVIACVAELTELCRGRSLADCCRVMGTLRRIIFGAPGAPSLYGLLHEMAPLQYPLFCPPGARKTDRHNHKPIGPAPKLGPTPKTTDEVFRALIAKHLHRGP